jgi:hypothetical protein
MAVCSATPPGKLDAVPLTPEIDLPVDEFAAGIGVDALQTYGEQGEGLVQGLSNPGGRLVSEGEMDSPAGFYIGHGQGVTKLPRRIAAVVLDEVNLEEARRFLGRTPSR